MAVIYTTERFDTWFDSIRDAKGKAVIHALGVRLHATTSVVEKPKRTTRKKLATELPSA